MERGKYRKLQIVTVEDLLKGKKPDFPPIDATMFAKAAEESREQGKLALVGSAKNSEKQDTED